MWWWVWGQRCPMRCCSDRRLRNCKVSECDEEELSSLAGRSKRQRQRRARYEEEEEVVATFSALSVSLKWWTRHATRFPSDQPALVCAWHGTSSRLE